MYKLLNAAFFRLKKNKIFYFLIIVTIVIALFILYSRYDTEMKDIKYGFPLTSLKSTDRLLVDNLIFIGFISIT